MGTQKILPTMIWRSLFLEDEVEVMVEVEEEVGQVTILQREIQVEEEEELVSLVMEEVKTCYRELWNTIDKIEIG